MENVGPTQARNLVPNGNLLLQIQIHGKNKGSWMDFKVNKFGHMNHRPNFIINLTYMEEEEAFWS